MVCHEKDFCQRLCLNLKKIDLISVTLLFSESTARLHIQDVAVDNWFFSNFVNRSMRQNDSLLRCKASLSWNLQNCNIKTVTAKP